MCVCGWWLEVGGGNLLKEMYLYSHRASVKPIAVIICGC